MKRTMALPLSLSLSLFAVIVVAATAVDATATVPKCSTEQRRKDGYSKGKREEWRGHNGAGLQVNLASAN